MRTPLEKVSVAAVALLALTGCDDGLDLDLRGGLGSRFDTSSAAIHATSKRPDADARGLISYPGYQVAVARNGDTVSRLADRIGIDPEELARYNGLASGDVLRHGELLALPRRASDVGLTDDITTIAGNAIDSASPTPIETTALSPAPRQAVGPEPIRHKVRRGETAYTIARLYKVSVRALADWNGLGRDFAVREDQYLLIPVALEGVTSDTETPAPGAGTATPEPPSASTPLPDVGDGSAGPTPASPSLPQSPGNTRSEMAYPVNGRIIRAYAPGKNDGIDIAADAGTKIVAAASGKVAAITADADQVPIIVIKHPDNLLTVYAGVTAINVRKGDSVSRGQSIASVPNGNPAHLHFEVRKGFDSVDPLPYLE